MNSPYKERWEKLLTPLRREEERFRPEAFDRARSPFARDYDRIIFSSAFRRLSKKTQVHPLVRNDHVHNRLTHTLEVSCVGRSLGTQVGYFLEERGELPDFIRAENVGEIVQAACLAHDIGNPPFGHAGESAVQDWFRNSENAARYIAGGLTEKQQADFKAFDGNAQGFRVITALENNKDAGGFRLTWPVLGAVVKYPRSAHDALGADSSKFNFYCAEEAIFRNVFSALGLGGPPYRRHPLSYLAEAADDICYRIVDMEDARELNIISLADIKDTLRPVYESLDIAEERLKAMDSDRRRAGLIRARLIAHLIAGVMEAFKRHYPALMEGEPGALTDMADEDITRYLDNAKRLFNEVILKNPAKTALEIGSYSLYRRLLDVFVPACWHKIKGTPTYKEERALCLLGVNAPRRDDDLYTAYLRVIDFITGMTDTYAAFISEQFSGIAGNRT